jgi:Zn-dependent protease
MPSLLDQLARGGPAGAPPVDPPPARRRGLAAGIGAALVLAAAKAKTLAVLALKFAGTAWTMLLAIWAYSMQVGWSFAALLVVLILVHEIGHGLAARCVGVRIGAPVFIPFLGAFIALRDRPRDRWEDFVIAAGGPLAGGLASLACLAASALVDGTARQLLYGCGLFALLLNLFNLLPVWILDGARMLPVVRTADGVAALVVVVVALAASALWANHLNGLAVIAVLVVAWQLAASARKARRVPASLLERLQSQSAPPYAPVAPDPERVSIGRRRIGALAYFGMMALYAVVLQLADPLGSP